MYSLVATLFRFWNLTRVTNTSPRNKLINGIKRRRSIKRRSLMILTINKLVIELLNKYSNT